MERQRPDNILYIYMRHRLSGQSLSPRVEISNTGCIVLRSEGEHLKDTVCAVQVAYTENGGCLDQCKGYGWKQMR